MKKDIYLTLAEPTQEILFKDKGSKFFGVAFPVESEEEIKQHIETIKNKHHTARHWCYAWQLGVKTIKYRANDDGEPRNSAGIPIYGQIQSFNVTNVLIIVVRYFGGVKLGVGGLIKAYKTAAQQALNEALIIEKTIKVTYTLQFDYSIINKVMRIIKENNLQIIDQKSDLKCNLIIEVRENESNKIENCFASIYGIKISKH